MSNLRTKLLWPEVGIWAMLLGTLAANVGLAFVPLGSLNVVLSLSLAAIMAGLVSVLFMELDRAVASLRIAAAAGPICLLVMLLLTFSDLVTR